MTDVPTCAVCAREAPADPDGVPPLDWASEREGDAQVWTCPECTRSNVRAIEAKLDRQWW